MSRASSLYSEGETTPDQRKQPGDMDRDMDNAYALMLADAYALVAEDSEMSGEDCDFNPPGNSGEECENKTGLEHPDKTVEEMGRILCEVPGDGNCLVRSVSMQLEGPLSNIFRLRQRICEHAKNNAADYSAFFNGSQEQFLKVVEDCQVVGSFRSAINHVDCVLRILHDIIERPIIVLSHGEKSISYPENATPTDATVVVIKRGSHFMGTLPIKRAGTVIEQEGKMIEKEIEMTWKEVRKMRRKISSATERELSSINESFCYLRRKMEELNRRQGIPTRDS